MHSLEQEQEGDNLKESGKFQSGNSSSLFEIIQETIRQKTANYFSRQSQIKDNFQKDTYLMTDHKDFAKENNQQQQHRQYKKYSNQNLSNNTGQLNQKQSLHSFQSTYHQLLPEPNNIIEQNYFQEPGRTIKFKIINENPDKAQNRVRFDSNDIFREKNYEDKQIWKTRPKEELAYMCSAGITQSHDCYPQLERNLFRCKQCQKSLKWVVFSNHRVSPHNLIIYNDFQDIVNKERENFDITVIENFTALNQFITLREFSYILLQRPEGFGFQQIQLKTFLQVPNLLKMCKALHIRSNLPHFRHDLQFFADYENANLHKIIFRNKSNDSQENEIEQVFLILKSDTNTKGFTQWFNFGLKYTGKVQKTYKFIILNNRKVQNLYHKGLCANVAKFKPEYYEKLQKEGLDWQKAGFDIKYYPNSHIRSIFIRTKNNQALDLNLNNNLQFSQNIDHKFLDFQKLSQKQQPTCLTHYSLEFCYTFKPDDQQIYLFAQCQPYTFTDMLNFLEQCEQLLKKDYEMNYDFDAKQRILRIKSQDIYYKKQMVGSSKLGFPLFKIQITSNTKNSKKHNVIPLEQRKVIFIIARQHPSDSPSSQIVEGIIKLLIQNENKLAKMLRQNFVFEIIPMANPDGVVVGNSRCNVSGLDMNKRWDNSDPIKDQEVYQIKLCLLNFKKEIFSVFDIQSSCEKVGCYLKGNQWPTNFNSYNWVTERLLQKMMNVFAYPYFELQNCDFEMDEPQSLQTFSWKKLRCQISFTLLASIYGYSRAMKDKNTEVFEFKQVDYEGIGESLLKSLMIFTFAKEKMRQEAKYNSGELPVSVFLPQDGFLKKQQKETKLSKEQIAETEKLFGAWNVNTPPLQQGLDFDIESYMSKNNNSSKKFQDQNVEKLQNNNLVEEKNNLQNKFLKKDKQFQSQSHKLLQKITQNLINNQKSNKDNNNINSNREISQPSQEKINQISSYPTNYSVQSNNQNQPTSPSKIQQLSLLSASQQNINKKPFKVIEDIQTLNFNKQILDQYKKISKIVDSEQFLDWKFYFTFTEIEKAFKGLKNNFKYNFNFDDNLQQKPFQEKDDSQDDLLENNRDMESIKVIQKQLQQYNTIQLKEFRSKTAASHEERQRQFFSPRSRLKRDEDRKKKQKEVLNKKLLRPQTYSYLESYSDFQKSIIENQNAIHFKRQIQFSKKKNLIYLSFNKPLLKKNSKYINFSQDDLNSDLIKSITGKLLPNQSQQDIIIRIPRFAQQFIQMKNPFVKPQTQVYQIVNENKEKQNSKSPKDMKSNNFSGIQMSYLNNLNHLYNKIQESKTIKRIIPNQPEIPKSQFFDDPKVEDNKNPEEKLKGQDFENNKILKISQQQSQKEEIQEQNKIFDNFLLNSEKNLKDISKKSLFQFYDPKSFIKISNKIQQQNYQSENIIKNQKNFDDFQQEKQKIQTFQEQNQIVFNKNSIKLNLLDAFQAKQKLINQRRPYTSRDEINNQQYSNQNNRNEVKVKKVQQLKGIYKLDLKSHQ